MGLLINLIGDIFFEKNWLLDYFIRQILVQLGFAKKVIIKFANWWLNSKSQFFNIVFSSTESSESHQLCSHALLSAQFIWFLFRLFLERMDISAPNSINFQFDLSFSIWGSLKIAITLIMQPREKKRATQIWRMNYVVLLEKSQIIHLIKSF